MPSVNMIAAHRAEKKRLEKLVYVVVVLIVSQLAVALVLFGVTAARMYGASRTIEGLDQKLAKIQPVMDKIQYYQSQIKDLEPRLNLLADSREQTLVWHTVLQNLSWSVPESTWLTSLTTNQPRESASGDGQSKPAVTIRLSGVSVSQRLVGETMLRLNEFPEFERVDLNYTQRGADQRLKTLDFQIAALLESNEPQKGEATDVSN